MIKEKITYEEALALLNNEPIEMVHERARISNEADKYIKLPINQWPNFKVIWDFNNASQRYSYDALSEEDFNKDLEHLIIRWVSLKELDAKFTRWSQRTKDETWTVGSNHKVARAIVHWVEGKQMSPAIIMPVDNDTKISIVGGHNRLAVCRAKDIEFIPVLIKKEYIKIIGNLIKVSDAKKHT